LLIKYIKSVLWRVAKCLSYIEEARRLKVNVLSRDTLHSITVADQSFVSPFRLCCWHIWTSKVKSCDHWVMWQQWQTDSSWNENTV